LGFIPLLGTHRPRHHWWHGVEQLSKHSGEYLLEITMRRYKNRSTVMTSNRLLKEWGKLLCGVPTAGAILDRFLHHAQVIAITGKSYHVKEAPVVIQENKKSRKSNEAATAGAASWMARFPVLLVLLCYVWNWRVPVVAFGR
jgi:hypothetical protein